VVKVKTPYGASGEDASVGDSVDRKEAERDETTGVSDSPDWLKIAQDSYTNSTEFLDSSLRKQWERAERSFQNKHPSGSKYLSDSYRARSKLFRPKTRATIRQGEAQAAASFFSNEDAITVRPTNENDDTQRVSAEINKELLQYRLTVPNQRHGIPWFMTVVGAYQDARKNGVVVSKQWWEYEERIEVVDTPVLDDLGQRNPDSGPKISEFSNVISSKVVGNNSLIFTRTNHSWHAVDTITSPEGHMRKMFSFMGCSS